MLNVMVSSSVRAPLARLLGPSDRVLSHFSELVLQLFQLVVQVEYIVPDLPILLLESFDIASVFFDANCVTNLPILFKTYSQLVSQCIAEACFTI